MALTHRGRPTGAIVHSDCGSQFRSAAFTAMIKTHGLASSVGAVGIRADDAATGILLSACPRKQQAQPLRLGHSQPAPPSHHRLDRRLPLPQTPTTSPGQIHTHRIRNNSHLNNINTSPQPKQQQPPDQPQWSGPAHPAAFL